MKKIIITAVLSAALVAPAGASAQDTAPADVKSPAKYCKALKAASEANFASMFGTKRNAYGKCVSQAKKEKAGKATLQRRADKVSAAETCNAAKEGDAAKFAADFGSKRNAFGKCVSQTAKQLAAERKAEQETAPTA